MGSVKPFNWCNGLCEEHGNNYELEARLVLMTIKAKAAAQNRSKISNQGAGLKFNKMKYVGRLAVAMFRWSSHIVITVLNFNYMHRHSLDPTQDEARWSS